MMSSVRPISLWQQCLRTIAESIMQNFEMCLGDSTASEDFDICHFIVSHVNILHMPATIKCNVVDEIEHVNSEHFRLNIEPLVNFAYPNEY